MTTLPEPVATPLTIDPALLDPNPYQPQSRLVFTPDQLADLASIKDIGFLQKPQVRMHSTQRGRYQIVFGHRRIAAWQHYRPGELVPVDLVAAGDRELFEHMVIENLRTDPSAIERAVMLRAYIQQFGATQAQAAPLFGLSNQASVSNLISLLDLPDEVQALVASGALPERFARRLRSIRSLNIDKAIVKVAQETAAHIEDEEGRSKEKVFENAYYELVRQKAEALHTAPFDRKWQPKVPADIGDGKTLLPACQGCAFNRSIMHTDFCLRPACWKAKVAQHAADITAAIAKTKHLPVAAPDEKIRYIDDVNMARAVLSTKHAAIRLAPKGEQPADYLTRSQHKGNTGSEYARVAVLASQADEVLKIVTDKTAAKSTTKTRTVAPTDWAKKQREQESKRKAYRAAVDATLTNLTPIVAAKLPNDRTSLELIATVILMTYNSSSNKESVKIADQWNKHKTFTAKPADLKSYIGREMIGLWVEDADFLNLADARKTIAEYCAALKITLPPHWDAALTPPAEDAKPVSKPKRK